VALVEGVSDGELLGEPGVTTGFADGETEVLGDVECMKVGELECAIVGPADGETEVLGDVE